METIIGISRIQDEDQSWTKNECITHKYRVEDNESSKGYSDAKGFPSSDFSVPWVKYCRETKMPKCDS